VQTAQAEYLRGQIAYDQRRGRDAVRLLLSAARLLEPLNASLARETHLEALTAAVFVGEEFMPGGVREAAEAARGAAPDAEASRPVDAVLDALALLLTRGYAAACTALRRALDLLLGLDVGTGEGRRWLFLAAGRAGVTIAMDLCDWDSLGVLATRQAQAARDMGALVQLRSAMVFSAAANVLQGDLTAAARLVEEERLIAEATRTPPVAYAAMMLAAWQGREQEASVLIEATVQEATAREQGFSATFADCSAAVLYNGLSRYAAARDAALRAWDHQVLGLGAFAVPELAEAAARTGEVALVRAALGWVSERTRVAPNEWALGIEARVRALLSDDEIGYQESIEHLARTRSRIQLARSHLLYGEWLNRQNHRLNARVHLRAAYDMLSGIGAEAFAERARHELLATGETIRKRTAGTAGDLTDREAYIARLAVDGRTNAEIGAQTFLSARTVEWHLRNVYAKLGVGSRRELRRARANTGQAESATAEVGDRFG
jgi:DNA-binding CsgD family transcriptional regulator